jgi:hypothetical protein
VVEEGALEGMAMTWDGSGDIGQERSRGLMLSCRLAIVRDRADIAVACKLIARGVRGVPSFWSLRGVIRVTAAAR